MASSIEQARAAFGRQAWAEAFSSFEAVIDRGLLEASDHGRIAVCAYLTGRDKECVKAWEAARRAALAAGDPAGAARYAFWRGFVLLLRGQPAQAAGCLAQAEQLIVTASPDCAAAGYVLTPSLLDSLEAGDFPAAQELAARATELGDRFDDADLQALGTLGRGQALIAAGNTPAGVRLLDGVMVAVTSGQVGPIVSGVVYCAVILECLKLFDMQRASEWTGALSAWCDSQPDLVPFRGQCLVHRSQLQQAAGEWSEAVSTARSACWRLTDPPHPAVGLAHYQRGELHRLTGDLDAAERAYRQASRNGLDPMPGMALLHLARGDGGAAAASIRRALREATHTLQRPALLAAAVDIFRATDDLAAARPAADELAGMAAGSASDMLRAMAAQATGAVLIGEGDPVAGLPLLRSAATIWSALRMPYECARVAILVGLACSALGDRTAAALAFDNAREILTDLGATSDLQHLSTLSSGLVGPLRTDADTSSTLSAREREVLAQVAAGKTNREIAAQLRISQHTVARHLEHVFTKLGVGARAAATAYAYEHDLL